MSLLRTLDIQFPNELSRRGSVVGQSTAVLLYKNRTLVSRTGSNDDDSVPEPLTGQYQTTAPAYFSPMKQGSTLDMATGGWGHGEQPERNTRMATHGQWKSNHFCNGVGGYWLPHCWQSDHSRWKRECGQLCENIVRKPSWFCRKHIWRQKSSIRVSTWQYSGPHGTSNCHMVGAAGHIHHSMDIPLSPRTLMW